MTAIILAGGRSSRFGSDKAFIKIGGTPLIEKQLRLLKRIFKKIIIVTNNPHRYNLKSVRLVKDIIRGRGPLGGIYSGLTASDTHHNFVVACDMPFLNPDIIRFMLRHIRGYDIVVVQKNRRIQPLHAIYSKDCIRPIENQIHKGNLRIRGFFKFVKVRRLPEERFANLDLDGLAFVNINTKKDYKKYREVFNHGRD